MLEIIPAILEKNFEEIRQKISRVVGLVPVVQIDVVDGRFASNKTWPYAGDKEEFVRLTSEKKRLPFLEKLDFEFDLMVKKPEEVIGDYVKIGASRVIVHIESVTAERLSELIQEWKHTVDIALALKPSTSLSLLSPFFHEVSMVQCMGNDRISFQGVSLDEERVLPKISSLHKTHPELAVGVDIGVNLDTAPRLIEAGANRLVAGSAIFGSENPAAAIEKFKKLG